MMKTQLVFIATAILLQFLFATNLYCEPPYIPISSKSSTELKDITSKKQFLHRFDIKKISNLPNEFSPICIDDLIISSPQSIKKIDGYLSDIMQALTTSTSEFAIFKYGSIPAIRLKLPCLGIGGHGIVFEIIDETKKNKQVLKLNIRQGKISLNSGIKENYNYYFWLNMAKNYSFQIAQMHKMHQYGLFCIKDKSKGILLTEYLVNNKIIFQDNKNHRVIKFRNLTQKELELSPIKEISVAILELLEVAKNNRKNCFSISPNNIFVDFYPGTNLLKTVELIDYGISTHKIFKYFFIKNFNQYIKMAAKRVKIYIEKNYILSCNSGMYIHFLLQK